MNILFDFHVVSPAAGGVSTVCRIFATEMIQRFPENTYYAIVAEDLAAPFVHIPDRRAGDDLVNRLLFRTPKEQTALAPVPQEGTSGARRIYRENKLLHPLLVAWRYLMGQRLRIEHWSERCDLDRQSRAFQKNCRKYGIDVIHCPYQSIRPLPPRHLTGIPYIMNLHDLQHEHFPSFFDPALIRWRRMAWYDSARACRFVVAAASHVQEDIVRYTGVPVERVPVIPWGVPFEGEDEPSQGEITAVKMRFDLPSRFVLYPAATWEHKNHLGLIKSLLLLKREGQEIPLILTGSKEPFWGTIEAFIKAHGLDRMVRHLGFVAVSDLKALYKLAAAVVVPSLHEQTSGPVMEAMAMGCPVAASRIADLPELLGEESGLLFDPMDMDQIARCLKVLWTEKERSSSMAIRSQLRLGTIRSWVSWGQSYNRLYRICSEERNTG